MRVAIQASVGIIHGNPAYNLPDDQRTVQGLLNVIPDTQGGTLGLSGSVMWPEPVSGQCDEALHQAILKFQRIFPKGAGGLGTPLRVSRVVGRKPKPLHECHRADECQGKYELRTPRCRRAGGFADHCQHLSEWWRPTPPSL
jgi:hypothetical protein